MNKTKQKVLAEIVDHLIEEEPDFFKKCKSSQEQLDMINIIIYGYKLGLKKGMQILTEDEDEELITEDKDLFMKVDGKSFRCTAMPPMHEKYGIKNERLMCGCNIFRKVVDQDRYVCNSCGALYQGE